MNNGASLIAFFFFLVMAILIEFPKSVSDGKKSISILLHILDSLCLEYREGKYLVALLLVQISSDSGILIMVKFCYTI